MIKLPNIDGKIWNIEYQLINMIHEMDSTGQIIISLNKEGPCAHTLGLYSLLDSLCNQRKYDKHKIKIFTHNQLEQHSEYQIIKCAPLYVDSIQNFMSNNQFPNKLFGKDFKHFALFIGRSNWIRLWMSAQLRYHYKDKLIQTFHYDSSLDFHIDHLGFDQLCRYKTHPDQLDGVLDLIQASPITINDLVSEYPIITPEHYSIAKVYHKFFVEVVCETYFTGNSFYPTEKIWRPIAMKTPFIIQGPKNYYKNLQHVGFRTFDRWWDEGFTEDEYSYQPNEIFKILKNLSQLSVEELEGLYIDMKDTLEHNYQVLMSLKNKDFARLFK